MSLERISKANKACAYYPCHKDLESCTFCYCPFYPCQDESLGLYVISSKNQDKVWSCQNCNVPHREKVVDKIFDVINKNITYLDLKYL